MGDNRRTGFECGKTQGIYRCASKRYNSFRGLCVFRSHHLHSSWLGLNLRHRVVMKLLNFCCYKTLLSRPLCIFLNLQTIQVQISNQLRVRPHSKNSLGKSIYSLARRRIWNLQKAMLYKAIFLIAFLQNVLIIIEFELLWPLTSFFRRVMPWSQQTRISQNLEAPWFPLSNKGISARRSCCLLTALESGVWGQLISLDAENWLDLFN